MITLDGEGLQNGPRGPITNSFIPPSKRHLSVHSLEKDVWPRLTRYNATPEHKSLLNRAIENEKPGFVGYHGARREFRIYQDVIRMVFEEVLHIPIREDFHFLRTPGNPRLNVNSAKEFLDLHPKSINDDLPLESSQLLSMNMALYEHFNGDHNQFSVYFFLKDTNWGKHDYEAKLEPFFKALGLDPSAIAGAFEIARRNLPSGGVLLQIFDTSIEEYGIADRQTYLAVRTGGRYHIQEPISKLIGDNGRKSFPQFRFMLNNKTTLNPYSPIAIKRYDLATPAQEKAYDAEMRAYFRALHVDAVKKDNYIQRISGIWEKNLEALKSAA